MTKENETVGKYSGRKTKKPKNMKKGEQKSLKSGTSGIKEEQSKAKRKLGEAKSHTV